MSNSLGKNELLNVIAEKTGATKSTCEMLYETCVDEIRAALLNGRKVVLKNFMVLEPTERRARKARNPKTGLVENYPAVRTVNCRVSDAIKAEINEARR